MKKILVLVLLVFPLMVSAAGYGQTAGQMICNVLQVAKSLVLAIGFGIVFIMLVIAGIKYITAGGDDSKTSEAKKGITNALVGLLIVASASLLITLAQGFAMEVGLSAMGEVMGDPCEGGVYQPIYN